ncbi:hypothetical protein BJV77DRAFT_1147814 [Russula vinacea]|nr:hypothetical protein BJV77DRAFT_1147814 [Russula vinacea]
MVFVQRHIQPYLCNQTSAVKLLIQGQIPPPASTVGPKRGVPDLLGFQLVKVHVTRELTSTYTRQEQEGRCHGILCGGRKVHMPGWSSDLMDKGSKVIRNAYKLAAAWCDKKHLFLAPSRGRQSPKENTKWGLILFLSKVFVPMHSKVRHSMDFYLTFNLPFNGIGMSHGLDIDVQVASGVSVTACGMGGYYIIEEGHIFERVVAIRLRESSIKQHHSDLVKEVSAAACAFKWHVTSDFWTPQRRLCGTWLGSKMYIFFLFVQ